MSEAARFAERQRLERIELEGVDDGSGAELGLGEAPEIGESLGPADELSADVGALDAVAPALGEVLGELGPPVTEADPLPAEQPARTRARATADPVSARR